MTDASISFHDLRKWGWAAVGHCGRCAASYPCEVAHMALQPTGAMPILGRLERRLYACRCGGRMRGVTLVGKVRKRDGMRKVVEMGTCPVIDPDRAFAEHEALMAQRGRPSPSVSPAKTPFLEDDRLRL